MSDSTGITSVALGRIPAGIPRGISGMVFGGNPSRVHRKICGKNPGKIPAQLEKLFLFLY